MIPRCFAWHTLEDGGRPDYSALDEIIERILQRDTDRQALNFARQFAKRRKRCKEIEFEVAVISDFIDGGKRDFCGEACMPIKKDFEAELDVGSSRRFAMVCEPCDKSA